MQLDGISFNCFLFFLFCFPLHAVAMESDSGRERKETVLEDLSLRQSWTGGTFKHREGKEEHMRGLTFKPTRYGDRRMRFISSDNCLISSMMLVFALTLTLSNDKNDEDSCNALQRKILSSSNRMLSCIAWLMTLCCHRNRSSLSPFDPPKFPLPKSAPPP